MGSPRMHSGIAVGRGRRTTGWHIAACASILGTIVVRRRDFVSGFSRPHDGESINARASEEDGKEEGGGKNRCHRVIVAVCMYEKPV